MLGIKDAKLLLGSSRTMLPQGSNFPFEYFATDAKSALHSAMVSFPFDNCDRAASLTSLRFRGIVVSSNSRND